MTSAHVLTGDHERKDEGRATIFSCAVNLANTVIGAGMLGLPGAFAGTGFLSGSVLIFTGAFFSAMGLRLLSMSAEKAGIPASFYTVARASLPSFTVLIDAAVALKCFGVATGYLITVGDCMVDAFKFILSLYSVPEFVADILESRYLWVTFGLFSVLPFSFFKTLDALQCASTFSLMAIMVLGVGVVAYAEGYFDACEGLNNDDEEYGDADVNQQMNQCKGDTVLATSVTTTILHFPVFIFSFTCQQNIFPVVNEIKNRTQQRIDVVIFASLGLAVLMYYIVAVEGYRTYGDNVRGDILLNYPGTAPVTIMRILIAAVVVLSYPLQLDPCRRCLLSLVASVKCDKTEATRDDEKDGDAWGHHEMTEIPAHSEFSPQNRRVTGVVLQGNGFDYYRQADDDTTQSEALSCVEDDEHRLFVIITCSFLILSYGIAMVVEDLGLVLALVGATGSTMVSYILPGGIYIRLHDGWDWNKAVAWLQLSLGCVIMPSALYFQFQGV